METITESSETAVDILFLVSGVETSNVGLPGASTSFQTENGKIERPYFDIVGTRNVTTVVGQTALLRCRVRHLGDRTVRTKIGF
jgi:hypothetical protein